MFTQVRLGVGLTVAVTVVAACGPRVGTTSDDAGDEGGATRASATESASSAGSGPDSGATAAEVTSTSDGGPDSEPPMQKYDVSLPPPPPPTELFSCCEPGTCEGGATCVGSDSTMCIPTCPDASDVCPPLPGTDWPGECVAVGDDTPNPPPPRCRYPCDREGQCPESFTCDTGECIRWPCMPID